jgi:galactokinase
MNSRQTKENETVISLRRLQYPLLEDFRQQYNNACRQLYALSDVQKDLLKIAAYEPSQRVVDQIHAATSERLLHAEELLNAVHLEMMNEYTRYIPEELKSLANKLCQVIESDEITIQKLEESDNSFPDPGCY